MSIDFEIEYTRITVGQGHFDVRGLNSEDLTFFTVHYLDEMKLTVARYADMGLTSKNTVAEVIMNLIKDFPSLVVEMISRCADSSDPASVDKFRRLSFVKQLEALQAIWVLTTQDGIIDLKKLAGFAESLLAANGLQPGTLTKWLQTIIATSENQ